MDASVAASESTQIDVFALASVAWGRGCVIPSGIASSLEATIRDICNAKKPSASGRNGPRAIESPTGAKCAPQSWRVSGGGNRRFRGGA